jgi:hypothetical protein
MFAGMAMQGIVIQGKLRNEKMIAESSVKIAKELTEELAKWKVDVKKDIVFREDNEQEEQEETRNGEQEHALFLSVHFHIFLFQKIIAFDGVADEHGETERHEHPHADGHDAPVVVLDPIPYPVDQLHVSSSSGFPSVRSSLPGTSRS